MFRIVVAVCLVLLVHSTKPASIPSNNQLKFDIFVNSVLQDIEDDVDDVIKPVRSIPPPQGIYYSIILQYKIYYSQTSIIRGF